MVGTSSVPASGPNSEYAVPDAAMVTISRVAAIVPVTPDV